MNEPTNPFIAAKANPGTSTGYGTPSYSVKASNAPRTTASTDARSMPQWARYIDSRLKQFGTR